MSLEWRDARKACDFLNCNASYPRGKKCGLFDDLRIYPSGDETTMTACEPSCFFSQLAYANANDLALIVDPKQHYRSDNYLVIGTNGVFEKRNLSFGAVNEKEEKKYLAATVDISPLHYSETRNVCELANTTFISFVTQPWSRSETHKICRQDNFVIGDDLVKSHKIPGQITGRHSRTYCNAFYKDFNEEECACKEKLGDRIMSYTFIGTALLRLARHAIYGEECDTMLAADSSRSEVDDSTVPEYKKSKRVWYESVEKEWTPPPPNILLSDLGITSFSQEWSNIHGLRELTGNMKTENARDSLSSFDGRDSAKTSKSSGRVGAKTRVKRDTDTRVDSTAVAATAADIYKTLNGSLDNSLDCSLGGDIEYHKKCDR